jgi:hypothetical protein
MTRDRAQRTMRRVNECRPQGGTMITAIAESNWPGDVAATSRRTTPRRRIATVAACVAAGTTLLQTGVAGAASRGFRLHNDSRHALRLQSAVHVPRLICGPATRGVHCVPAHYPMEFEGRPSVGAVLAPGGAPHAWELKYGFDLVHLLTIQYAAELTYRIEGTGATVSYVIATTPTTNDSECKVVPAHDGRCTAEGLKLTFGNPALHRRQSSARGHHS